MSVDILGKSAIWFVVFDRRRLFSFTLSTDQIHSGDINLDPDYQRGVVWSKKKQMDFIDSMLHNYHVFEIIFGALQGLSSVMRYERENYSGHNSSGW